MRSDVISCKKPEKFLSLRVGVELHVYDEDLDKVLRRHQIGAPANFIITPIASPSQIYTSCCESHTQIDLLPDLVVSAPTWETKVAVSIPIPPLYSEDNQRALEIFEALFRHALFLPAQVIVIDCPESNSTQSAISQIINQILENYFSEKLILFRVRLRSTANNPLYSLESSQDRSANLHEDHGSRQDGQPPSQSVDYTRDDENTSSGVSTCSLSDSSQTFNRPSFSPYKDTLYTDWFCWDNFRHHLRPDHRIGVCLAIQDDLESDIDLLNRWCGEPVRMVTLSVDRFVSKPGFKNTMQPAGGIREFLRMIALSNSLMTSFVVETRLDYNIEDQVSCLSHLCDNFDQAHADCLRAWNDVPLSPLQPLSTNLDSSTYQIFERDLAKYTQYHEAMVQALDSILRRDSSRDRTNFVIMVLGAGRGPLVGAMIQAIHKLRLRYIQFKIYAVDKNHSSIVSLNYKKRREWDLYLPNIVTEVVDADMRTWEPAEKADIIATELLGSFSDNELSPECIDGTWRFATKETISIPQSYCSYLSPICSQRMFQEMYKSRYFASKLNSYDQIYVARLTNFYTISNPQKLFEFQHLDLSKQPVEGANEREVTLTFKSKVATTCHGFAGYFSAELFGSSKISTVPEFKTPTMESWFATYIPIEKPIRLLADDTLIVKFFRKESHEKVWYEWLVLHPEQSRVFSQGGKGTVMSKII